MSLAVILVSGLAAFAQEGQIPGLEERHEDGWVLVGDAELDGVILHLTSGEQGGMGMAMAGMEESFDLSGDFTLMCRIYLGDDDEGGEGIALFLADTPLSVMQGPENFLAITIETLPYADVREEFEDPEADAIIIMDPMQNAVAAAEVDDLESGEERDFMVKWVVEDQVLQIFLDDFEEPLIGVESDIVEEYLGGSTELYIGWAAASMEAFNEQYVAEQEIEN